jgi:hypothetical protein
MTGEKQETVPMCVCVVLMYYNLTYIPMIDLAWIGLANRQP